MKVPFLGWDSQPIKMVEIGNYFVHFTLPLEAEAILQAGELRSPYGLNAAYSLDILHSVPRWGKMKDIWVVPEDFVAVLFRTSLVPSYMAENGIFWERPVPLDDSVVCDTKAGIRALGWRFDPNVIGWDFASQWMEEVRLSGYYIHFTTRSNLEKIKETRVLDYRSAPSRQYSSDGNFAYSLDVPHTRQYFPEAILRASEGEACILFYTDLAPDRITSREVIWDNPVPLRDFIEISLEEAERAIFGPTQLNEILRF